jgi:exopolyphosphatase/guanosine-5'-triphosphate,3'-diphosphate pyrophosphatase
VRSRAVQLPTFLAARRWCGWSAGRLAVLDIGGGSLELAVGADEHPDNAESVPLGAGRLTREWFSDDPPPRSEITALEGHLDAVLAPVARRLRRDGDPDLAVGTSKTFRSLARLTGAGKPVLTAAELGQLLAFITDSRVSEDRLPEGGTAAIDAAAQRGGDRRVG